MSNFLANLQTQAVANIASQNSTGYSAAQLNGIEVTCYARPYYNNGAQQICHRVTWKFDGKAISYAALSNIVASTI